MCFSSFILGDSDVKQDREEREGKGHELCRTALTGTLECWLLVGRIFFSYQLTSHLTLVLEAEANLSRFLGSPVPFKLGTGFSALAGHFKIIFATVHFLKILKLAHKKCWFKF